MGVYVRKRDEFSESTGDKEAHVSDRSEKPGHDPREDGETRAVDQLVDEYVKKSIDRRQFFKRAGLLGVSIGGAAALLAACGGDDDAAAPAPAEPAPAEPAPAPADPEPAPADPEPAPLLIPSRHLRIPSPRRRHHSPQRTSRSSAER